MTDQSILNHIAEALRLDKEATPGPWSIEACGEKGDGANLIGVAFGPGDETCACPLEGWLQPFDDDGNEIEYYRDELVAECEHRNRSPGYDAAFIARSRTLLPLLASDCASEGRRADEAERKLETERDETQTWCLRVEEYRGRLEQCELLLAEVTRQRDEADAALVDGAVWFEDYAREHFAKGADDKGLRNGERAITLRNAARHRAKQQPGETR